MVCTWGVWRGRGELSLDSSLGTLTSPCPWGAAGLLPSSLNFFHQCKCPLPPLLHSILQTGAAAASGATQRASELSRVALAVYEAGGKAIHVPLPGDHPLVSVISSALASGAIKEEGARGSGAAAGGSKAGAAVIRKGAAEVAEALLEQIVQLMGTSGAGEEDRGCGGGAAVGDLFSRLVALHALVAADASLVVPQRDPQRFVRALAPYATAPDAEALQKQSSGGSWVLVLLVGAGVGQDGRGCKSRGEAVTVTYTSCCSHCACQNSTGLLCFGGLLIYGLPLELQHGLKTALMLTAYSPPCIVLNHR